MKTYNGDFVGVRTISDGAFGNGQSSAIISGETIIEFVWSEKITMLLMDGSRIAWTPEDHNDSYEKRNMKASDIIDHPRLGDSTADWLAWLKKEGVIFNNTPKE